MTPAAPRRFRLGLRREVSILLPTALLLLVVLSTFTLFSYRSAVVRLTEERRNEAAALARVAAERLAARGGSGPLLSLLEIAPRARGMAVLGSGGDGGQGGKGAAAEAVWGEIPAGDLAAPLVDGWPVEALGVGPGGPGLEGAVAGFAPFNGPDGRRRLVRLDLPAGELLRQRDSLKILVPAVLALETAVLLLVLFYLSHLLTPYETLLARAREVGATGALPAAEREDEVAFLLAAFDYALTELKERQVERSEEDIATLERTLAASLESGVLLLDRHGKVLALNPVGSRLLDVETPPPGIALAELLAGQPELSAVLAEAVAAGRSLKREECTVHTGGGERTLGLTAHPLSRGDGSVRGYLVLFADLTEVLREAQETRLAESLASLGELAGGVAHELRNGLATLRGYLTLIERRPDEDSVADYLGEIRRETDHLGRVVEDFLSFARPGTARLAPVSLEKVARSAAADPALDGMPVTVDVEPEGGADFAGDEQLLSRALRNLLHNAVQAEREAGRAGPVEIRVTTTPGGAALTVEDRGRGLPPQVRQHLFAPFVSGRPGGVGLGLALARRIVVLHGGRLTLEDREGGGTRATLFFPQGKVVTGGSAEAGETAAPPAS